MLVAIEGIDASGKNTQARLLESRAGEYGISTCRISFPRYDETVFGKLASEYLNGDFGQVYSLHPKLSALLFAGDRFESKSYLEEMISSHKLVILDRYVSSNLAYQAAKLPKEKRLDFIEWLGNLEYGVFGLPFADITIFLDIAVETASRLVYKRGKRSYTNLKADIHESDPRYLQHCGDVYHFLAKINFKSQWHIVPCASNSQMLDSKHIAESIWTLILHSM